MFDPPVISSFPTTCLIYDVVGNLPAGFAPFAAYWDLATGALAILALPTVRIRPLFWFFVVAFNLVGIVNLILDYYHAVRVGLPALAGQLGAAYAIPVYAPLTHDHAHSRILFAAAPSAQGGSELCYRSRRFLDRIQVDGQSDLLLTEHQNSELSPQVCRDEQVMSLSIEPHRFRTGTSSDCFSQGVLLSTIFVIDGDGSAAV